MKFNKMRIAALAMAAVMTATSIAPSVMAEELLSAGEAVEEVAADSEVVEEVPEAVEDTVATGLDELLSSEPEMLIAEEATTTPTPLPSDFTWVEGKSFVKFLAAGKTFKISADPDFAGKTAADYPDIFDKVFSAPANQDVCLFFLYNITTEKFSPDPIVANAEKNPKAGSKDYSEATCQHPKGYDAIANANITTSDGSVWTKGAEGFLEISPQVDHQFVEGKRMVNYMAPATCLLNGDGIIYRYCKWYDECHTEDPENPIKIEKFFPRMGHDWAHEDEFTWSYVVANSTVPAPADEPIKYVDEGKELGFFQGKFYGKTYTDEYYDPVKKTTYTESDLVDDAGLVYISIERWDPTQAKMVTTKYETFAAFDAAMQGDRYYADGRFTLVNTKLVNGEPVLINDKADGFYAKKIVWECKNPVGTEYYVDEITHHKKVAYEIHEILAKEVLVQKVVAQQNIAVDITTDGLQNNPDTKAYFGSDLNYTRNYYDKTLFPYNDPLKIPLIECNQNGYYWVTTFAVRRYVNPDGTIIEELARIGDSTPVLVEHHHMPTRIQIEFPVVSPEVQKELGITSWADQCTVIYHADGSYTIDNFHCKLPVPYFEVVHCASCQYKQEIDKTLGHVEDLENLGDPAKRVLANNPKYVRDGIDAAPPEREKEDVKFISAATKLSTKKTTSYWDSDTYDVTLGTYSKVTKDLYNDHLSDRVISIVKKDAPPTGNHYRWINHILRQKLEAQKDITWDWLVKFAKDSDGDVSLEPKSDPATCVDPGEVTVWFKCKLCGELHGYPVKVYTPALGHLVTSPIVEIATSATCTREGLAYAHTYCGRCGIDLVNPPREIIIPKDKHSNQLYTKEQFKYDDDITNKNGQIPEIEWVGQVVIGGINGANGVKGFFNDTESNIIQKGFSVTGTPSYEVDEDGHVLNGTGNWVITNYIGILPNVFDGATEDYNVSARVYTNCEYQNPDHHDHIVDLTGGTVTIEVIDLVRQQYLCGAGRITLAAKYTVPGKGVVKEEVNTFPYYNSMNAYQTGRGNHIWGESHEEIINNERVMVTRCTACGMIQDGSIIPITDEPTVTPTPTEAPAKVDPMFSIADMTVTIGDSTYAIPSTDSDSSFISYSCSNPEIAEIDMQTGKITGLACGYATITAAIAETSAFNGATTTFQVTVRPLPTVVLNLRDEGAGTMFVKWRIKHGVDGYQFAWATDPEFTDIRYSATFDENKNTQRRYGLESATYYVKARTFVIDENGKRLYSKWSGVKTIDICRFLEVPEARCTDLGGNKFAFEVTRPTPGAAGYQISIDGKTASYVRTKFTRQASTAGDEIKIRAYAYAEDGKYFSDWVVFE